MKITDTAQIDDVRFVICFSVFCVEFLFKVYSSKITHHNDTALQPTPHCLRIPLQPIVVKPP